MSTDGVWVVLPAFNEAGVIDQVLDELTRAGYRVVIVDDGSDDDTGRRAQRYPVTILRHICNLGQGAALQTGISYALRDPETRFIVTFDSDGQHGTADIARLLDPLKAGTHDVVLGSRFAPGGDVRNIGWLKRVTLRLAVAFTRLTTGLAVTDTHNGLRALSSAAAARIKITHNHMAHASELLAQIGQAGLRYCEVPVTITYTDYSRAKGQSVLNSVNILWDILRSKIR